MIRSIIKNMTIKEKVGQLCVPILQSDKITDDIRHCIEDLNVGMIRYCPDAEFDNASQIVGSPNKYFKPSESAAFLNSLQKLAMSRKHKIPLLISVDQEGSTRCDIDRAGAMVYGAHMAFGVVDDVDNTYRIAKATAEEFRSMGINILQAPILDVLTYEGRKTIKASSFGMTHEKVARHACAMKRGLTDGGLLSMSKHFPGYGSIATDAHKGTARIIKDLDELERVDIYPYKEIIKENADAIMMGHVIVESIDPEYPATLSKKLVTDYLRGKLGFKGFIMTDAMRMKAIADNYGIGPASVMAIKAGCDLLLLRGDMDHFMQGYSAVLAAAESGEIAEEWIDTAIERVLLAKERAGLFANPYADGEVADATVGCAEHKKMLKEFADKSITVVRGEDLPLKAGKKILAITVEPQKIEAAMDDLQCVDMLPKAIRRNNPDTETLVVELDPTDKDIEAALNAAKDADTVIFATCDAILYPNQAKLAKAVYETGKPFIAVAMNSPYDLEEMDFVKNYVCTYGVARQWVESASDVIFGKLKGDAKLPVDIK